MCLALLVAGLPSLAAANDKVLKNIAVAGSLASYGYGAYHREKFSCQKQTRIGLLAGRDQELSAKSIFLSLQNCTLADARQPVATDAVQLTIEPSFMLSQWRSNQQKNAGFSSGASEISLIPKVQWRKAIGPVVLDTSLGIGASYLSRPDIGLRSKSTRFQFSDEFGLGLSNRTQTLRLAWVYRHISNADIRLPNQGVDYKGISVSYAFD